MPKTELNLTSDQIKFIQWVANHDRWRVTKQDVKTEGYHLSGMMIKVLIKKELVRKHHDEDGGYSMIVENVPGYLIDAQDVQGMPPKQEPKPESKAQQELDGKWNVTVSMGPASKLNYCPCCGVGLAEIRKAVEGE